MYSQKFDWSASFAPVIINFFIAIAVFPLFLIAVPFAILETTHLLNIPIGDITLTICVVLLGLTFTFVSGNLLAKLLPVAYTNTPLPVALIDALISLAVMGVVAIKFTSFHYVTPSSSVLYYIFYDYARLFLDTGFYRPELPSHNPSGTWHSMLTYNPALGATAASLFFGDGIEAFRRTFTILMAISTVGAMAWLGIFSRCFVGTYLPGIAMGFFVFVNAFQPAGLLQWSVVIGSHDLPMFYFAIAGIVLTFVTFNFYAKLGRDRTQSLILFTLVVNIFGLSLRPYLLSLVIISLFIFIYLFYRITTQKATITSKLHFIFSHRERLIFNAFIVFIGIVGIYWFGLLLVEYATPVIYAHSTQFRNLSDIDYGIEYQLRIAASMVFNDIDGGYVYFSSLHDVVAGISALLAIIVILFNHKNRRPFLLLFLMYLLMLLSPLISQTGMHWKSFYNISIINYILLPILGIVYLFSVSCARFPDWRNTLHVFLMSCMASFLLLPTILPTDELNKLIANDQAFRVKVAELHEMRGGKLLVIRGGEPGGDSQILIPKYYYWDNVFFFGDLDSIFKESTPSLSTFICMLHSREVTLVFDPTKLDIQNHSGKFAYDGITRLLDYNPTSFIPKLRRLDGYKGVLYSVEYTTEQLASCK